MSELLTKMSDRTLRRGCRDCGRTDVYWAKRESTGKFALVLANDVTRAVPKGGQVSADYLHDCRSNDTTRQDVTTDVPVITTLPAKAPEAAPSVPELPAAQSDKGADTNAVQTALQTLMAAMQPGVNRDEIAAIVRDEVGKTVFPIRTVVIRENDEPREVKGSTHYRLADVITALQCGEHVLMVGPAGTGKSTIASQAAEALNLASYSLSLSPQTSSAVVFGYMQAEGKYVRTLFREAYEFGGVFNFDELDNGHPSILAAINGALANGHAAFPDCMVERHRDFRCVGSANTYGRGADRKYVGRQALDAATLDRFTFLTIDIDEALEDDLCRQTGANEETVRKVLAYVRKVRSNVESHSLPIVVSPRASVGMCRLLAAGFDWSQAVDARVRRGLSDADWSKASAGTAA